MTTATPHEVPLEALAEIKPGYPFRGAIKHDPKGSTRVVQVRHLDPEHGFGAGCQDDVFDRVTLEGRRKPDYLKPGDLLFVPRGSRFFAVAVPEAIPEHTVCSQHFFLIRLTAAARGEISPAFLAWQINHHDTQAYLARWSQGSAQHSVTKPQLKSLPVAIPHPERQALVVAFHRAAVEETAQLQALIDNRTQQVRALGSAVLAQARASGKPPQAAQNAPAAAGHH